jgi:long-chain acyl-CoA synthetase
MNAASLPALHRRQVDRLGPRVALRYRKHGLYHDLTWADLGERVAACAAALVAAGLAPGDRVGLLSENRAEWLIADMGILSAGLVNVPLHAPLTPRQVQYQLADAGARWLFVSDAAQYEKVRAVRGELPELRGVVAFDPAGEALSWGGFLQRGRAVGLRDRANPQAGDLATIIYTSGTTGLPKGVMLTHANLVSNAEAFVQVGIFPADAVFFNWLPFSHVYARTVDMYVSLATGLPLCLAESGDTILADVAAARPTNLSAVPRFYEKVLAAVQPLPPAERGRRLRGLFGARIDWLGSGGAPLPLPIAEAYRDAGLLLLQGYGLTESSPVISFNRRDAYKLDSVGRPIPGVQVRIGDDGEILTRGPHVMKGYWNDPAATAAAIEDGWLHTGDLGRLDADGFLYVTGRKKELLVLSSGKKVVPSYLEGLILADPCVDQVVVCGEGRNYLSALVVPHWPNLCRTAGLDATAGEDALARDGRVVEHLTGCVRRALADLSAWEQVKKVIVLPRPFTVAAEELTVSLKLRRSVILEHHLDRIDPAYRD